MDTFKRGDQVVFCGDLNELGMSPTAEEWATLRGGMTVRWIGEVPISEGYMQAIGVNGIRGMFYTGALKHAPKQSDADARDLKQLTQTAIDIVHDAKRADFQDARARDIICDLAELVNDLTSRVVHLLQK